MHAHPDGRGAAACVDLPLEPHFEDAVLVLNGELHVECDALGPDTLVYLGTGGCLWRGRGLARIVFR